MTAWINFAILLISSLLFLYFYHLSVSPAAMEMIIGPKAYKVCFRLRAIAIVFEVITIINYIVYYFYPLPVPFPNVFPWLYWVSFMIAVIILIPSGTIMVLGMKDAGEELARPKKEHTMYGGIYKKIRHPQAAGEVFLWWVIAFLLHSPFLALFSFVYIPIFLMMCWAEEHDLLIRYGDAYADYVRRTGAFFPKRKMSQSITKG
jgi:protein-S-isoprenylcysteine O-methyltransferase Ste14